MRLNTNVTGDQIRHCVHHEWRRITRVLHQKSGARNQRFPRIIVQGQQRKAQSGAEIAVERNPSGAATASRGSKKSFRRPIYRHNTSVVWAGFIPDFSSCFTYIIVLSRKTFSKNRNFPQEKLHP